MEGPKKMIKELLIGITVVLYFAFIIIFGGLWLVFLLSLIVGIIRDIIKLFSWLKKEIKKHHEEK